MEAGSADLEVLLRKCRRGDQTAWAAIVERFQSHLFGIGRRCGLSQSDAEDVMVSTFSTLYQNLERIDSALALPRWLTVTATREAIHRFRKASRQKADSLGEILDMEVLADPDTGTIEEMLLGAEAAAYVRDAFDQLPERCQLMLGALFFEQDTSYQDLIERMKIPMGSIGPTRSRCLFKLRQIMINQGYFDVPVLTKDEIDSIVDRK